MRYRSPLINSDGFTLVEMIVVMAIFVTIIIITGETFNLLAGKSSQTSKSAESQIEGIVGLEMLRRDLAEAGFGLPWDVSGVNYAEVTSSTGSLAPGINPQTYNDAPNAPRAVLSGNNVGFNSSDYLVVKSTITGLNTTSPKWYMATFSHYTSSQISAGERLIALRTGYSGGSMTNKVLVASSGQFTVTYPSSSSTFPAEFRPQEILQSYTLYGVAPSDANQTALRMPFNRSDYYIKRPSDPKSIPDVCAKPANASLTDKGVGILYRSTASQISGSSGGGYSPAYPVLDCVADMQVVYSLDSNGDGIIDLHSDTQPDPSTDKGAAVRTQVREVRVYILAQDGRKSLAYRYPNESILVGEVLNGVQFGRVFNFSSWNISNYENYHWRLYTLVVPLGNLN